MLKIVRAYFNSEYLFVDLNDGTMSFTWDRLPAPLANATREQRRVMIYDDDSICWPNLNVGLTLKQMLQILSDMGCLVDEWRKELDA